MHAAAAASSVVTTALHGDVLVVTIDNPPVNALGAAVRQGLLAAMQQAQADAAVAAVLLVGAGKAFIAGADIREFGKPPVAPILPEVCRAIENLDKPVVAVLHGAALGGGLEVAAVLMVGRRGLGGWNGCCYFLIATYARYSGAGGLFCLQVCSA